MRHSWSWSPLCNGRGTCTACGMKTRPISRRSRGHSMLRSVKVQMFKFPGEKAWSEVRKPCFGGRRGFR